MFIGNLFAFATQENGMIKIPKAALPGLDNPATITAGQFFASVILRGQEYYPPQRWGDRRIAVSTSQTTYPDFAAKKLIGVYRTETRIISPNSNPTLEDLK